MFRSQGGNGSHVFHPITDEKVRIKHATSVSNKNVINLVMSKYPEPSDTVPEPAVDEPGPELLVGATAQNPPITTSADAVVVPRQSWPVFQNQQSVLNLTKTDHDALIGELNQNIRAQIAEAMPGARVLPRAVEESKGVEEPRDLRSNNIAYLKHYLGELAHRHGLAEPAILSRRGRVSKDALMDEIRAIANQFGHGSGPGAGTSTHQLEELLERVGLRNCPVIASDQVKDQHLDHAGNLCFIMNTDPISEPGKHWIAVSINTKTSKSLDYFDSLGRGPTRDFLKQIKKVVGESHALLKLKVNAVTDQAPSSDTCGWHALKFLSDRITRGQSFAKASGFSQNAERRIEKYKQEYI